MKQLCICQKSMQDDLRNHRSINATQSICHAADRQSSYESGTRAIWKHRRNSAQSVAAVSGECVVKRWFEYHFNQWHRNMEKWSTSVSCLWALDGLASLSLSEYLKRLDVRKDFHWKRGKVSFPKILHKHAPSRLVCTCTLAMEAGS